jgi:hypothetical protein
MGVGKRVGMCVNVEKGDMDDGKGGDLILKEW